MNEVYGRYVGDKPPARATVQVSGAPRWAPRSRSRWSRTSESRPKSRPVSAFAHSLGLDAYLVGGAVRDELLGRPAKDQDFVVPGRRLRRAARRARAARAGRGPRGRRAARRAEAVPERPRASLDRAGRDRVRAAAHRALDGAGQARLRDRRVARDLARAGHGAPRLHDQRDREAPGDRRAARSVRRAGKTSARACSGRSRPRASARTRCGSSAGSASSPSTTWSRTSRRSRRCARTPSRCGSSRRSASAGASARTGWVSCRSCSLGAHPAKALRLARDTGVLVRAHPGVRTGDRP